MKKIRNLILFFIIIIATSQVFIVSNAQIDQSWSNFYINSNDNFTFEKMAIDSNNSIILVGNVVGNTLPSPNSSTTVQSSDSTYTNGGIIKLDRNGHVIWSNYFGGSKTDTFSDVIIDSNNNILVVGSTYSSDLNEKVSYNYSFDSSPTQTVPYPSVSIYYSHFLIKYSPDGKLLWVTLFNDNQPISVYNMALGINNSIILSLQSYDSVGSLIFDSSGKLQSNLLNQYTTPSYASEILSLPNNYTFILSQVFNSPSYSYKFILTKVGPNLQQEWSMNLANVIPNIYQGVVSLTSDNNIIFSGSFDNSNSTNTNSDYYTPELSLFSILIYQNGTVGWKYELNTTGDNSILKASFYDQTNGTVLLGVTDSSNYPLYNSINSSYEGNEDLTLTILDSQGKAQLRTIFGGSGYDYPQDMGIMSDGTIIIVANSYQDSVSGSQETIIFAVKSDGTPIQTINFASIPPIYALYQIFVNIMVILILLCIFTIFNAYTTRYSNSENNSDIIYTKKSKQSHNLSSVFCPNDGARMLTYTSRTNPSAEFIVPKDKIDIALANAIAMRKIFPYSAQNIKNQAITFFERFNSIDEITFRATQCPACHYVSATPVSVPEEFKPEEKDKNVQKPVHSVDELLFPKSKSLFDYINPFPPKELTKDYFKDIITFNQDKLAQHVKNPEITKMTTLAIIITAFFPIEFTQFSSFSAGIGLNALMYFLIFLLTGYIYTYLVKPVNFRALDNFRLLGIILWINFPIIGTISVLQLIINPSTTIYSYNIGTIIDITRLIILLIPYTILLAKLTRIGTIANIFALVLIFIAISYVVIFLLILGFLLMILLPFFAFWIIIYLFSRERKEFR